MKKLFLLAILMAFLSCSDDDDNSANSDLKEYPVHYIHPAYSEVIGETYFTNSAFESYKFGLGGIRLYFKSAKDILVSDGACPYEWDKNLKPSILHIEEDYRLIQCEDCKSIFDRGSGIAISGPAKDQNLKLVSYKIEIINGDYIFSNPRYKK